MIGQIDLFGNEEREVINPVEEFRKECEELVTSMGTGFINGKLRIKDYYAEGTLTEEVLKKEYGTGGQTIIYKDGSRGWQDHGAKGIMFVKGNMTVSFDYKEVLKLIKGAIYDGRY